MIEKKITRKQIREWQQENAKKLNHYGGIAADAERFWQIRDVIAAHWPEPDDTLLNHFDCHCGVCLGDLEASFPEDWAHHVAEMLDEVGLVR